MFMTTLRRKVYERQGPGDCIILTLPGRFQASLCRPYGCGESEPSEGIKGLGSFVAQREGSFGFCVEIIDRQRQKLAQLFEALAQLGTLLS